MHEHMDPAAVMQDQVQTRLTARGSWPLEVTVLGGYRLRQKSYSKPVRRPPPNVASAQTSLLQL